MLSNIGVTIIIIVPVYAHMLFVLSFDMTVSKKYVEARVMFFIVVLANDVVQKSDDGLCSNK